MRATCRRCLKPIDDDDSCGVGWHATCWLTEQAVLAEGRRDAEVADAAASSMGAAATVDRVASPHVGESPARRLSLGKVIGRFPCPDCGKSAGRPCDRRGDSVHPGRLRNAGVSDRG